MCPGVPQSTITGHIRIHEQRRLPRHLPMSSYRDYFAARNVYPPSIQNLSPATLHIIMRGDCCEQRRLASAHRPSLLIEGALAGYTGLQHHIHTPTLLLYTFVPREDRQHTHGRRVAAACSPPYLRFDIRCLRDTRQT